MKCLLAAVNAKYIHSNLAVYSLKNYALNRGVDIDAVEYTINNSVEKIVEDIYIRKPDILAFSCYIWNIEWVKEIVDDISKVLSGVDIWLGGPEVSYECEETIKSFESIRGIVKGEGEETFARLMETYAYVKDKAELVEKFKAIDGIMYRDSEGNIFDNKPVLELNMDSLPFVYDKENDFENKIIYYESSRGCPFRCSYCLSSIDKKLRYRDLELVKKELGYFLDKKVSQVKFIDRTFNANRERTKEIWKYILENDNGITNFHFEISADLLDKEELELISRFRPGLAQLEAGIQSTCTKTLHEINRYVDFNVLSENIRKIIAFGNTHCHVDLIAGLPYEDIETFKKSFNDVYSLKAEQLQLGFLKVLKGSPMYENASKYGISYKSSPPYEVLFTKWLTYEDVLMLKGVEEMVEVYYNSGQFVFAIECLERHFENAFEMYQELAGFYKKKEVFESKHSRQSRYELLLEFVKQYTNEDADVFKRVLTIDYYARENAHNRPAFAACDLADRKQISDMYAGGLVEFGGEKKFGGKSYRNLINSTHIEYLDFDIIKYVRTGVLEEAVQYILFDYDNRNPLNSNAEMIFI